VRTLAARFATSSSRACRAEPAEAGIEVRRSAMPRWGRKA